MAVKTTSPSQIKGPATQQITHPRMPLSGDNPMHLDFLEQGDLIVLSLCSYTLYSLTEKPRTAPVTNASRVNALTRIAADIPSLFACNYCLRFHETSAVAHPAGPSTPSVCGTNEKTTQDSPFSGILLNIHGPGSPSLYQFRLHHVLAATKNYHRKTGFGTPPRGLAYTEIVGSPTHPPGGRVTTLLSVNMRTRREHSIKEREPAVHLLMQTQS
ncbi:hypothetical protein BDW74DRAFT_183035 [Aspergillus multicolor]|uniref:uncharacterized protein n=1 Tax=Aspergillus multicolor TaxID=41759 RepID=UPI003CCDABA0